MNGSMEYYSIFLIYGIYALYLAGKISFGYFIFISFKLNLMYLESV